MKDQTETEQELIKELKRKLTRLSKLEEKEPSIEILGGAKNITEYKKALQELTIKEEMYRLIVENTSDLIAIIDFKGKLLYVSPSHQDTLGFSKDELIGKNILNFIKKSDIPKYSALLKEHVLKLTSRGNKYIVTKLTEVRAIDRLGNIVHLESKARLKDNKIYIFSRDITKRKKLETELADNLKNYRALFHSSPVAILEEDFSEIKNYINGLKIKNKDEIKTLLLKDREIQENLMSKIKINDANQAALDLYGAKDFETLQEKFTDIFPTESFSTCIDCLLNLIDGKNSYSAESMNLRLNGDHIFVRYKSSVIKGYDKSLEKVIITVLDISKNKKTLDSLQQSEEKFRSLAESSPNIIFIISQDKSEYVNRAAEKVLGYQLEEFYTTSENLFKYFAPESRELAKENFQKHFRGEEVHPAEYLLLDRRDNKIPMILTTKLIKYQDELAVLGIVTDISERKYFEKKLKSSEKLYRSLFEDSPISLWLEDFSDLKIFIDQLKEKGIRDLRKFFQENPDQIEKAARLVKVIDVNNQTLLLYGVDSKKKMMHNLNLFFNEDSYKVFIEEVIALANDKTYFDSDAVNVNFDGKIIFINMRVSILPGHEKDWSRIIVSMKDITERKKAEKTLKNTKKKLEEQNIELKELDKLKDMLIRDVGHELKTPVAKHLMQIELLKDNLKKNDSYHQAAETIKVLERSTLRLSKVITNILELSKIEYGIEKFKFENTNLSDVINLIHNDFFDVFKEEGIDTKLNMNDVFINTDQEMLWHVFSNLIENAIKFKKKKGKSVLKISLFQNNGQAQIDLSDNGIGIEKEKQKNIFNSFYQVNPSEEGCGLGLAISKMVVDNLGGKIKINSPGKNKGTTVSIMLPLINDGQR